MPTIATAAAFFMIVLDTSIVNLALGRIGAEFTANLAALQWLVDGYALVFASLLLGAGALGDRYGARGMFMVGLIVFTTASALCVLTTTINGLQIARIVQGIGAALLLPNSLAALNTRSAIRCGGPGPSQHGPAPGRSASRSARCSVAFWSKRSGGAASSS